MKNKIVNLLNVNYAKKRSTSTRTRSNIKVFNQNYSLSRKGFIKIKLNKKSNHKNFLNIIYF